MCRGVLIGHPGVPGLHNLMLKKGAFKMSPGPQRMHCRIGALCIHHAVPAVAGIRRRRMTSTTNSSIMLFQVLEFWEDGMTIVIYRWS